MDIRLFKYEYPPGAQQPRGFRGRLKVLKVLQVLQVNNRGNPGYFFLSSRTQKNIRKEDHELGGLSV